MNTKKTITVSCPTCGKPVPWNQDSPWRPFCSERCKLIDLGDWVMEKNRIPAEDSHPNPDAESDDTEY